MGLEHRASIDADLARRASAFWGNVLSGRIDGPSAIGDAVFLPTVAAGLNACF
jgi:hypothetical protein